MNHENLIELKGLGYQVRDKIILQNLNLKINQGTSLVITGPSGSGKTTLARILCREIKPTSGELRFAENVSTVFVSQQDRFVRASGLRVSYYNQRFENPNEEGIPNLSDFLYRKLTGIQRNTVSIVLKELEIDHLVERKILSISNGERKRVQIAEALLQNPDILVLDQPFIGLDVHSRETLSAILYAQKTKGISLILVCDEVHIPEFADQVLLLDKQSSAGIYKAKEFLNRQEVHYSIKTDAAINLLQELAERKTASTWVVRMKNAKVVYGGKAILNAINWEIKSGQKWLIRGPNGAGKTTLLSLISADNPQSYSNDLTLFDRKRGSGESIWDIKKKIGFVSPELHHYFLRRNSIYKPSASENVFYNGLSCHDVVLSGLNDEIGFTSYHTKFDRERALKWLRLIGMEQLAGASFLQCSLGEQRAILLARALIKSPELLILDEPCQGLDQKHLRLFLDLLDLICTAQNTTLIYVTHRAEEIPRCITHELELQNGRVIKNSATRNEVY